MKRHAPEDYEPEPPLFFKPARVLGSAPQSEQSKSKQEQNMAKIPGGNGPGVNKASGSKGSTGPSTKMSGCASNAGSANVRGGVRSCGTTGSQGAQPNKSGSKGSG